MFKESVTVIIKTTIIISWQTCKNYPHLLFTSEKNSTASGESTQRAAVTNNTLQDCLFRFHTAIILKLGAKVMISK